MNLKHLCQHWVHAEEENTAEAAIYRSKGLVQLAPRRFRTQYIFHPDGQLEWLYLAPNCGHYFKPGTWRLDPDDDSVLYLCQPGGDIKTIVHPHPEPVRAPQPSRQRRGRSITKEEHEQWQSSGKWPDAPAREQSQPDSHIEQPPAVNESRCIIVELSEDRLGLRSGVLF